MKKIFIVLGIVGISLVCISIFKNSIIKFMVTKVASHIIGSPVHMDRVSLSIFTPVIYISGLKIYNPEGFPKGVLASFSKINAVYDRSTLLKKKRHFLVVNIDLEAIELTKNKEGKLNVDSLNIVKKHKTPSHNPMQIDLLNLNIGKIVKKDYTKGKEPSVRAYDVNRHKSFKGIPSLEQLIILVLAEPLKDAAIETAEIYGLAMLTGVASIPISAAATFIHKDSVQQIIAANYEHVYEISLEVVKSMGKITKHDVSTGMIKANISGAMVSLYIRKNAQKKIELTISARKYLFPEPDIAGGVLYQILEKI